MSSGGVEAVLDTLIARLRAEKKYHELFEALLMRTRYKLGLGVLLATPLDDLPEPVRTQVEEAYLDGCREVGRLLLEAGELRAAWMYLRPVGDKSLISAALDRARHNGEQVQEVIEIALHEGVDPALGYRLVLENYGTCNAITTFEGAMAGRSRTDRQAGAALLLEHVHNELLESVKADVARREGSPPEGATIEAIIGQRPALLDDANYHLDTTHLAATVRLARILEDLRHLALALDVTRYGKRLHEQFQFAGEEPFAELYTAHEWFYQAMLGEKVDEALEYFRGRAAGIDPQEHGTLPVETLVVLLAHSGRMAEAIEAAATLLPPGMRTTGFAPSLLELSRQAGDFERALAVCQDRGDLIGFAASLIESREAAPQNA